MRSYKDPGLDTSGGSLGERHSQYRLSSLAIAGATRVNKIRRPLARTDCYCRADCRRLASGACVAPARSRPRAARSVRRPNVARYRPHPGRYHARDQSAVLEGVMNAIVTEMPTIWRMPGAAGAARRRSPLLRLGLRRARAAVLRFLDSLVPPGPPRSSTDGTDWPRYPGF